MGRYVVPPSGGIFCPPSSPKLVKLAPFSTDPGFFRSAIAGACCGVLLMISLVAQGAGLTWDNLGVSPANPADGAGNWDTASALWSSGAANSIWNNAANNTAVFGNNHGAAGTVNVATITAGGITFNAAGSGSYTLAGGTLTFAGASPVMAANVNATIGAVVAGTAGLTKTGAGTLTLTGANTLTGLATITTGVLKLQGVALSKTMRSYAINPGAVLNMDGSGLVPPAGTGTISGAGTLRVSGGTWNGTSSAGSFSVNLAAGGLLDVQSGASIQNGGWSPFTWSANQGGLNVSGSFDMADGRDVTVDALSGAGTIAKTWGTGTNHFTVGVANGSGTLSGKITNASGLIALTKSGTGTQTLAGTNTYTGATRVEGGRLTVNGSLGATAVTVVPGASLGGTGTINGHVQISWGGLAPGNTLTLAGGLDFSQPDASTMVVDMQTTNGALGVVNPLQMNGGMITVAGTITLQLNLPGGTLGPGTYTLITGATSTTGAANVILSGAPAGLAASLDTSTPGKLVLVIAPIPPAFPGAEGFGANATGGRGGTVYHVTNLNDSGTGSFRDAVSQPNRTVVFDVGGIITLASEVEVLDNITIAGQTAPGQGISTYGNTVYLNHGFGAADSTGHSNIIIRHMRFREGYKETGQAYSLALKPAHTVIIDHCSVEVGNWQTFSITYNAITGEQPSDITVQNSIIGASVSNQLGVLDWSPVNLTWHHNLFLDNGGRDPKASGTMQIINDVVYNYILGVYGDGSERCDFIGNYHIAGPDTNATSVNQGMNFSGDVTGVFYTSGNYWDNNRDGALGGVALVPGTAFTFNPVVSATPICNPAIPVSVDPAKLAYYKVVSEAGTSLSRDPLDSALIDQVVSLGTRGPGGTAGASYVTGQYLKHVTPYTDPVSGNPLPAWSITGGTAPVDTDLDGMPDEWELAAGWNPAVADGNVVLADGYTRLEHYLNWMAEPHQRLVNNAAVTINLTQYSDAFNPATSTFAVASVVNGAAMLLADGHSVLFSPGGAFTGLASFAFNVTAQDGTQMTRTVGMLGSPPKTLVWKGDGAANAWDQTTANWLKQAAAATYNNADTVVFDDSGSASPAVNLTSMATPGTVTFNHSAKSYVMGGGGSLAGDMSLVKTGSGGLTLWPNISVSSTTVLNSTAVTAVTTGLYPGMSVTGTGIAAATTIAAIVDAGHLTLSQNATAAGTATLTYYAGNSNTFSGGTSLLGGTLALASVRANQTGLGSGPVTFGGGTLTLFNNGSGTSAGTFPNDMVVTTTGTLNAAPRCVISGDLTGSGTLNYYTPYVRADLTGNGSAFTGRINVTTDSDGGDFRVINTYGYGSAAVTLGPKVTLNYGATSIPTGGLTLDLGELAGSATTAILQGSTAATANVLTWRVGGRNGDATYAGTIAEANTTSITAVTKVGSGTWTLAGASSNKGAMTVGAGKLAVSASLTGAVTATAGSLAPQGTPTITGNLAINSGGRFEVRLNGPTVGTQYDQLSAGGTVTLNGALDLIAAPGLAPASSFKILNKTSAGAVTGTFAGKPNNSQFGAGGYSWVINYADGDGNDVVVTLDPSQAGWRYQYFGTTANTGTAADSIDINGDGESNFYEYATCQDPFAATRVTPTVQRNGANLEFTYLRSKASLLDGVTFTVEWSDTLAAGSWGTTGITNQNPAPIAQDTATETLRILVPVGSGGKRFVHLKVAKP